ncbi:hypothetical protein [Paenibacillus lutrae]|uniref:Uncharacterized protein n=1 Tax=Paenibacillus lutrae TaxID=2078573 RepID=A0A7X3K1L0_9BACL|nr:hypothetical protein [Paenibacillus lutrae]MVP02106.1 hypothetical protein [Paenibacillus lutrae]
MIPLESKPSDREPLSKINWYIPDDLHRKLLDMSKGGRSVNEHVRNALDVAARTTIEAVEDIRDHLNKRVYLVTGEQRRWLGTEASRLGCDEVVVLRMVLKEYIGGK